MRDRITEAFRDALEKNDLPKLAILRLIRAAIVDQDSSVRAAGKPEGASDVSILAIINRMIRHRESSAASNYEHGQVAVAEREQAEISMLRDLLPRQLTSEEVAKAVDDTISEIGATGIRDKGRVMEVLRSKYRGQMDFSKVRSFVDRHLC